MKSFGRVNCYTSIPFRNNISNLNLIAAFNNYRAHLLLLLRALKANLTAYAIANVAPNCTKH